MNSQDLLQFQEAYSQVYSVDEEFVDPEHGETPSGRSPLDNVSDHPKASVRRKAVKNFRKQMEIHYGGKWRSRSNDPVGEEVEIAAQYFYEMGLNEDGVEIVIEELGLEGFVEFVSDLSEEYVLTEAKFDRLPPVSKSGKPIASLKGGAKSSAIKSKRQIRTVLRQKIDTESQSKPGMKAALQRQTAIATAKEKQPEKKGVLDRLAGAVLKGIERHNAAMAAASETGKTIGKAAKKIGGVAKEVGKGATGAAKLAGHVASKGLEEEAYEVVLSYLLDEGFASTEEKADKIILSMSEEWFENIMELNRYAKETGKSFRTGRPTSTGGKYAGSDVNSQAMRSVLSSMGAGRPGAAGRGKKKDRGGPTPGPVNPPAAKVAKRRAAAQHAQDMMHSRYD